MHKFTDTSSGEAAPASSSTKILGGENMFARRGSSREDEGYLICFTYGDSRCPSAIDIIDAATMKRQARIAMPAFVPNGFHGLWVDGQ